MAKSGLGRGLGALLGTSSPPPASLADGGPTPAPAALAAVDTASLVQRVALSRVHPSPLQPRKVFPAETLRELADSIREQGILQPLLVRPRGDTFELIAGERRWRAAQLAGLAEVPVIAREADDHTLLEMMLVENLQRENLNPIEEAEGYAQLIEQFKLRQEEAAAKVGKSRTVVANALRLLKLPVEVQSWLKEGRLSVGHAKVILGLSQSEEQKLAAERVLKESMNVRQTETLVEQMQQRAAYIGIPAAAGGAAPPARDVHVADLERRLQEHLGAKVQLRYRQGKGRVEIRFYTDADLERLLALLGVNSD